MATFVLVHGSFQGSWCWSQVVARLESRGHRAVTLDLPAHGSDRTPVEHVTMQDYVDAIARVVGVLDEPPVLVGHSMGSPIAGVAESQPASVAALVFVAGLLPPAGTSLLQMVGEFDPQYLEHAIWAADRRSVAMSPTAAHEFLFSHVPTELVDRAIPLMTPEPIAPYETPFEATDGRFGLVPRYYVETRRDRVVLPAIQKSIQSRVRFQRVLSLDTGHAPYFSTPDDLVSCLESVSAER
jgi:pimeloyl-ACP methyl ester carboxylesterase